MTSAGLGETWEELRKTLKQIRAADVCVTRGQLDKGMVGIASPIWQGEGQIIGSVSIAVPEDSVSASDIAGTSSLVRAAAHEIDAGIKELAST